ncbi:MAG: hypothetical protein H5T82_03420 [Demequina sp.]|nr:hypothetical protein [Demequina sp.]
MTIQCIGPLQVEYDQLRAPLLDLLHQRPVAAVGRIGKDNGRPERRLQTPERADVVDAI